MEWRNPDGAQRNPGTIVEPLQSIPDFASLIRATAL
jgi:hypothetical protein